MSAVNPQQSYTWSTKATAGILAAVILIFAIAAGSGFAFLILLMTAAPMLAPNLHPGRAFAARGPSGTVFWFVDVYSGRGVAFIGFGLFSFPVLIGMLARLASLGLAKLGMDRPYSLWVEVLCLFLVFQFASANS